MKACCKLIALLSFTVPALVTHAAQGSDSELQRWKSEAQRVQIVRDNWGIPHVYGNSDADAVFGMLYAQAEDNFNRIELNYINAMGRLAEVEGEAALYSDLRMKLFVDPIAMQARYSQSPTWLKKLMNSFADGLNYYLATHPDVKPKLITHFEPWMALCFSEGSIGGDIEEIDVQQLEQFYGKPSTQVAMQDRVPNEIEPGGSNGFAIAPSLSATKHALLLINPHTTFYFRPEIQVTSKAGLNAYGAVTWGQFFVYQGFNPHLGWMHTSGGGNVISEYLETVTPKSDGQYSYRFGKEDLAVQQVAIKLRYLKNGQMAEKTVTALYTRHGPVVRKAGDQWVAVRLMQEPVKALMQSYLRTKAKDYAGFYQVMQLRTNSSNNTVYADDQGNIAYFHGNFMPKRDAHFDWTQPLDGSNPATEWRGLHEVKDTITLFNPPNGWIQNTNNWPFSAAGPYSPKQAYYPAYMWTLPENPRGIHAVRVLENRSGFTLDSLISAAYDTALPAFDVLIPALVQAWDECADTDPLKAKLREQITVLRNWDRRYAVDSVPTALAIYWGQNILQKIEARAREQHIVKPDWKIFSFVASQASAQEQLAALDEASSKLEADFGSWKTPWGEINRFQHLNGAINQPYDDGKPSLPIAFTSSLWGSLAAFGATSDTKTRRIYGNKGNSFVAVVEFGPTVHARSVLAGGESGDPASPHFNDQALMYSRGEFKDVLFYPKDVQQHSERSYHPGQ